MENLMRHMIFNHLRKTVIQNGDSDCVVITLTSALPSPSVDTPFTVYRWDSDAFDAFKISFERSNFIIVPVWDSAE